MSNISIYTDKTVMQKYLELPQGDNVQVYYIWIDGTGQNVRGKTKTMSFEPKSPEDCPIWNYDGSSTGQATGENSDTYVQPVAMFADPFRGGRNKLLLCDTYDYMNQPIATNHRVKCKQVAELAEVKALEAQFGFEQEYVVQDLDGHPFGWPKNGYPGPQGPYYCSVGANKAFGRDVLEAHYNACLVAGVKVAGTNMETMPSQMEFQIGPLPPLEMADHLWVARYLLFRTAEDFGLPISIDPKPQSGEWSGSGGHVNVSTKATRADGGIRHEREGLFSEINKLVERLGKHHSALLKYYDPNGGRDNERRLIGRFETSSFEKFTSGVADRHASVRVPRQVVGEGRGYVEDRRPASNADPYVVCEKLLRVLAFDSVE